jgi:hypothetical protein
MKRFFREFKKINWGKTFFGSGKRTVISLILFIPLLIFVASFGYQMYLQQNPAVIYAHKLQTMTDQVNKSIALPKDEAPVVATVTDKNLLPKETFFSYAKDGDKILMYKKHKMAILYRPSLGVVITEAKLDFRNATSTSKGGGAVAGASTSANTAQSIPVTMVPVTAVPPTAAPAPSGDSSRTTTYHPQGKVLVMPQQ